MRACPPPPCVIAVDVDGTLLINDQPNEALIEWCRAQKVAGFDLMLWSSRGAAHAQRCARAFGIEDLFVVICSKPGYVVDDQGWGWIKFTRVVRSLVAL